MATLALYLVAGAVWVAVGAVEPDFMLAWPVTVVYLVVVAWLVPTLIRRAR